MKKKKLTKKQTIILFISVAIAMAAAFFILPGILRKKPEWSEIQTFRNSEVITTVQQTYTQSKSSKREFFLIQGFDFSKNEETQFVEVDIDQHAGGNKEYIGYTNNHIWLTVPTMTAVDMSAEKPVVLNFEALNKLIVSKNSSLIKSVLEIYRSENHLIVTNEQGDKFFLNAETFQLVKNFPGSQYEYHRDFHLQTRFPENTQYEDNYWPDHFITTDGSQYISLVQVSESNHLKFHFVATNVAEEEQVDNANKIVTDKIVSEINNNTYNDDTIPNQPMLEARKNVLGAQTFVLAKAIGLKGNQFVFTYRKSNTPESPLFLAWFDINSMKVSKEIDLVKEGFTAGELNVRPGRDEMYVFVTQAGKVPKRYKL